MLVDTLPPSVMRLLQRHAALENPPGSLDDMALRAASVPMRDIFAAMATGQEWDYEQLRSWVQGRSEIARPRDPAEPDFDVHWVARLARVVAKQGLCDDDHETALQLYWMVHDHANLSVVAPSHRKLFCDLLLWARQDVLLATLLPDLELAATDEQRVRADLENPHRGGPLAKPEPAWRRRFAKAARFPASSRLGPTDGVRPFDHLHITNQPATTPRADRLVTVVMNVYRPDTALRGAVRSILDQSWDEVEVVIVDDGSGSEFSDLFSEVSSYDERIRLVTLDENVGAYGARNVALDHARGDYVTFQDYDDWSLPTRLEAQVEALEADPSLIATRARTTKLYEDLTLAHPGYDRPVQIHAASLMFRREPVCLGIGYFDTVRKGADNEYLERILAYFGKGTCYDLPWSSPSLMAYRRTAGSLSREEFRPGWQHPDRSVYWDNYKHWHRTTPKHELFVPADAHRRFPAPHRFRRERPPVGDLDVVIIADVRPYSPHAAHATQLVQECAESDMDAGLHPVRLVTIPERRGPALTEDLQQLVHDRRLELVHEDLELSTQLVIVLGPAVLQFASRRQARWDVDDTWIVDPGPTSADDPDSPDAGVFLRDQCIGTARERFGPSPLWLHGTPAVFHSLATMAGNDDTRGGT